jgi:carotenoid cleavage dioxygenase-like enzyme
MSKSLSADALYSPDAADTTAVDNLYLHGPFAPVNEELDSRALRVQGQIPPALNGLYVRIGPNPMKPPKAPRYHWFTGDGMVHGVRLQGGQASWYRNRYIGSKTAQKALGRPTLPGDTRGIFDTINTNVYAHAGRIWASVEAGPAPVQLNGALESVKHGLFDSPTTLPFSAHPHLDPLTGDMHAVCYDAIKHRQLQYLRVNAQGQVDKVVPIPVKHGPMVHDCAITRSQVVVMDLPVTFSWWALLKREPFPYHWNAKHPARVGLLPREGTAADMRWFDVDPCFVFHPCNAFDLPDGGVVMDVVVHRDMFNRSSIGPEADTQPRFERWTMPAGGTRVLRQVLHTTAQEFPRLDERLVTQPYRWAYAVGFDVNDKGGQQLFKHDLAEVPLATASSGAPVPVQVLTQAHRFAPQCKPGEFVFVPNPQGQAEDDGWLLGYVANLATQKGELHVLDARDVSAPPLAVVSLPGRVPMGFHGNWVDAAAVREGLRD